MEDSKQRVANQTKCFLYFIINTVDTCHPELVSGSSFYITITEMNVHYYVYIITNISNSVFYIGVTNNLRRRIYEHKNKIVKGFSSKYNLNKLVYYETFDDINFAIEREKQLKNWHREWKINLVIKSNPDFSDLYID